MSQNIGTLLGAPIRPADSLDAFPAFYSNEGLGGWHQVTSTGDRDSIPVDRRTEGMVCYVISGDITYQLKGGLLNSNWTTLTTSGSISGAVTLLSGRIICDISNTVYTVSHSLLDISTSYPVVSLEVPSISSEMFIQGISRRLGTSFDIVLSGIPEISGYIINWHLPIPGAGGIYGAGSSNYVSKTGNETISGQKTFVDDLIIDGKLTVTGLIDPTGLELVPQASNPGIVTANTLWLNSQDSNKLYVGADAVGTGSSNGSGGGSFTPSLVSISGDSFAFSGDADVYELFLTSPATLNPPSSMLNGKSIVIKTTQPDSGNATLDYFQPVSGLQWKFPAGNPPSTTLTAGAVDIFTIIKINNGLYITVIKNFS